MNKPLKRTLFAYRLHGHLKGKAIQDYHALFQSVERIPAQNREERINDRAIALPKIEIEGECVTLTAYEGEIGLHPLLYDLESTNERTGTLRKNEVVATRTHIIIDLQTRQVVAEYNHRGAKALDVIDLIASLARRNSAYGGLTLELPPIAAEGFMEELRKFERVRVASIELVRPNFNWDDCEDALGKFAGDSNAARIGVTFTAQRDDSLSKSHGIIETIKGLFQRKQHVTKKAHIVGTKEGSRVEESLNLENFVEKRSVEIARSAVDGHPEPKAIIYAANAYLGDLRKTKKHAP